MGLDVHSGQHPDFSAAGYQVIRELGRNQEGGRITYLADVLNSSQKVVIKEFCFASATADWFGEKAYEREIAILQKLNHSRIPRYVNSFETAGSFYLVLEYKNAPSLGVKRNFATAEIQQIALSILEILVYLQQQVPPIIHRDIKPENILVDTQLNAYLVDFGLARIKGEKTALTSFVAGTPGFMPPEEHFGHTLTEASDLYSLGVTLICLLSRHRAVDIGKLIDHNYRFNLAKLVPQINPSFASWLQKMIEPNRKCRYANASAALRALQPIYVFGDTRKIDYFFTAMQWKKCLGLLGLIIILTLAVVGVNLLSSQPSDAGRQIIEIKEL
jgi:serine/threonine protein kinase